MSHARLGILLIVGLLYAGTALADPPLPPLPQSYPAAAAPPAAPEPDDQSTISILSIIPSQGEPGMDVSLSGSGFNDTTVAYLGTHELLTNVASPNLLSFRIPDLQPGLYALYVKKNGEIISKSYNFPVIAPHPAISDLEPDEIYACSSGREREIKIVGTHFTDRSMVLFDGAGVRTRFLSDEMVSFQVPTADGNQHKVQVRNADGNVSGALNLTIESRPEIENVRQSGDMVGTYNLIIEGRNFQQNSSLVISEQDTVQPERTRVKRLQVGSTYQEERERVYFTSCSQLVYERHPYSPTDKLFSIQVVNPSGEESSVVQVSAP